MRKPGGYATMYSPRSGVANFDGMRCEQIQEGTFEADTFSCHHCNRVIHVKPRMDPADFGGLCKLCYQLICPGCVGKGCDPLEEKLRRWEDRERFRRDLSA